MTQAPSRHDGRYLDDDSLLDRLKKSLYTGAAEELAGEDAAQVVGDALTAPSYLDGPGAWLERFAHGGANLFYDKVATPEVESWDAEHGDLLRGGVQVAAEAPILAFDMLRGNHVASARAAEGMMAGDYGQGIQQAAEIGDSIGGFVFDATHDDGGDTTLHDTVQNMVLNAKMKMSSRARRERQAQAMSHYAE